MMSGDQRARFTGPILFDFDGPIAHAFSGYPAHVIAADLLTILEDRAIQLPEEMRGQRDPMEVLRWSGTIDDDESMRAVEDALCAAEVQALAVAEPTVHAHRLIERAVGAGRAVSIVSNNSAPSIVGYLKRHGMANLVHPIVGRAPYRPDEMKPNPVPILKAVTESGAQPSDCVLIGDSLTDIQGAQAAGVRSLAYANKPWKVDAFRGAHADVVITDMGQAARLLGLEG